MRSKLGNLAFLATLVLLAVITVREVQYWTRADFVDQKYGYPAPRINLDTLFSSHVATILTWIAVVAAFASAFLLFGRVRVGLVALVWLGLGLTLDGHFFHPAEGAVWIAIVVVTGCAVLLPVMMPRLRRFVVYGGPHRRYYRLEW